MKSLAVRALTSSQLNHGVSVVDALQTVWLEEGQAHLCPKINMIMIENGNNFYPYLLMSAKNINFRCFLKQK